MRETKLTAAAVGFAMMLAANVAANAGEITVISSNALKTTLEQLAPAFEKATEHKLVFIWGAAVPLKADIEKGATFDLAVLTTAAIDDLIRQGKLVAATRAALANSGAGVAVRKGAPKPDIGTVDAFKRAMLGAKSIGYLKIGTSGAMVAAMLQRIGLSEAIKDKLVLPQDDVVSEMVAEGKIEVGMVNISQILTTAGVDLVGPLPPDLQSYIVFSGGVSSKSAAPDAARELIRFFKGPAVPVIKAQGMEPG